MLQQRMVRILSVLKANLDIVQACENCCVNLGKPSSIVATIADLNAFRQQIEFHRENINRLVTQSQQIIVLVSYLLITLHIFRVELIVKYLSLSC